MIGRSLLTPSNSIIAVHGLGSNVDWSWTWKDHTRKQHVHWLKDANMLPAVVPESRVLAYNYDSKWPRALAHVRTMLCGPELTEPLSLAGLLLESAGCWEVLGYYTAWEGFLIQTLELREQLLCTEHPETARARFHLTKTLIYIGIDVETQEMLRNFRSHSLFGERIAFLGLLEKFEEEKLAQQSISKSR